MESRQLDAMFDTILSQRIALSVYDHRAGGTGDEVSEEYDYFPGLHGVSRTDRRHDEYMRQEAKGSSGPPGLSEVSWAGKYLIPRHLKISFRVSQINPSLRTYRQ